MSQTSHIGKRWEPATGTDPGLIFEAVDYLDLEPKLRDLPPGKPQAALRFEKPGRREPVRTGKKAMLLASADLRPPGVVFDWILVYSTGSLTCLSYQTYKVDSAVSISSSLSLQPGTVLKYTPSGSLSSTGFNMYFSMPSPGQARAVLTHINDDSIGDPIAVAPGDFTQRYSFGLYFCNTGSSSIAQRLDIRHAEGASKLPTRATSSIASFGI